MRRLKIVASNCSDTQCAVGLLAARYRHGSGSINARAEDSATPDAEIDIVDGDAHPDPMRHTSNTPGVGLTYRLHSSKETKTVS